MNEIENQNSMADEELKEIAEKLEKELGHQYFDKPVDLTTGKTQEKNPELLELEKEMENLGEIILPGADLKPEDELPAGEQILALEKKEENKPAEIKYKSFRLFQGKTDEEKNAAEQQKKLQTEKQAQEKITREQEKEKAIAEKTRQKEIEKQEKEKAETEKKLQQELERQKKEEREKAELEKKEIEKLRNKEIKEKEKQIKKQEEELELRARAEQKRAEQEKKEKEKQEKKFQTEKEIGDWKKIKEERQLKKIEEKNKKKQEHLLKKEQRKKERAMRPKFGWYVAIVKRPVVYLCAIEFMAYFGALLPFVKNFFTNVILSYIIILDLIVFIWLAVRIKKHYAESYGTAIKAVMLAGLLTGFFRAVFKVIWINESWTIFNVIFEPLIWAGYGMVIGLIVGGIIKRQTIQNISEKFIS